MARWRNTWEEGASDRRVLGGQLVEDGPWGYLRLSVVDGARGDRVQAAVRGVEMRHIEDEVAQRARADGKGDEGLPIEVELRTGSSCAVKEIFVARLSCRREHSARGRSAAGAF